MNTKTIGNIGEAIAIAEFTKRNIPVLIPFGDNLHYDLVIDYQGFKRVQVKTCQKQQEDGSMIFKTSMQNNFVNLNYDDNMIDYLFLYCIENNLMCLVPVSGHIPNKTRIRTQKPKNNQCTKVKMYEDYQLDKILK